MMFFEGNTFKLILLEGGKYELHKNGENEDQGTWELFNDEKEVRLSLLATTGNIYGKELPDLLKIEPNGDLTVIARIKDNKREEAPKEFQEHQFTFKKIKSEAKETTPKVLAMDNVDVQMASGLKTTTGNKNNNSAAKPVKVLKKSDVIGSYEAGLGGITFRFVLLESGVVENYFNGIKEPEDAKWKIQGAEVHIEKGKSDGTIIVNKIEPNGDFTVFARIRNGKREDFQNRTYKRIRSENETPSKGDDDNSNTAKPPKELTLEEKVVGEYEIKEDGNTYRLVLLDNGNVESYANGKKEEIEAKWKLTKEGEIHVNKVNHGIVVVRINKDRSITIIAQIGKDGEREEAPKEHEMTLEKIK